MLIVAGVLSLLIWGYLLLLRGGFWRIRYAIPPGFQGVELAGAMATKPDFFLFTDADIEHAPDSLSNLVSIARAGPCDLVSFMVKLHCEVPAEKLLIPAFVFFFFKLYPPAWIANPRC